MERLTKYAIPALGRGSIKKYPCFSNGLVKNGCPLLFCHKAEKCDSAKDRKCPYLQVMDKLAAYEDKGLQPEEITTEPYGCVFYCNRKCNLDGDSCVEGPGCPNEINAETAKHLLELAQAEKDGRLIVRKQPTIIPLTNDPLTLEELREMDGEPVWITPGGFWALVIARRGERVRLINHESEIVWADKEIELVGPVYRRKPEEGKK